MFTKKSHNGLKISLVVACLLLIVFVFSSVLASPAAAAVSTPTKTPCPLLTIYGYVRQGSSTGPGMSGVAIQLAIANGAYQPFATTNASGYYTGTVNTKCHQETLRLKAVLSGYTFTPANYTWSYYGYGGSIQRDFVGQ